MVDQNPVCGSTWRWSKVELLRWYNSSSLKTVPIAIPDSAGHNSTRTRGSEVVNSFQRWLDTSHQWWVQDTNVANSLGAIGISLSSLVGPFTILAVWLVPITILSDLKSFEWHQWELKLEFHSQHLLKNETLTDFPDTEVSKGGLTDSEVNMLSPGKCPPKIPFIQ